MFPYRDCVLCLCAELCDVCDVCDVCVLMSVICGVPIREWYADRVRRHPRRSVEFQGLSTTSPSGDPPPARGPCRRIEGLVPALCCRSFEWIAILRDPDLIPPLAIRSCARFMHDSTVTAQSQHSHSTVHRPTHPPTHPPLSRIVD